MNSCTKLELQKLCNKNTLIIGIVFALMVFVILFQSLSEISVVGNDNKIHRGIECWKILKERTKPYEGVLNTEQIYKIRDNYENSLDKQYLEGKIPVEREVAKTLAYPFFPVTSFLNEPYKSSDTYDRSLTTEVMLLTDKQIDSFYESLKNYYGKERFLKEIDHWGFTSRQIEMMSIRYEKMIENTDLIYKYYHGWDQINSSLMSTFFIFLIFLAFKLSNVFVKNDTKGIDQLALSTKYAKSKLVNYKIHSSIIFASIAYVIYLLILFIPISFICTLSGGNFSMLLMDSALLYDININQYVLITLLLGYGVTIVIVFFLLFLSIVFKNNKIVIFLSSIYFIQVQEYKLAHKLLWKLQPQKFIVTPFAVSSSICIGDVILPPLIISLLLMIVYVVIFKSLIHSCMKRYYLQ